MTINAKSAGRSRSRASAASVGDLMQLISGALTDKAAGVQADPIQRSSDVLAAPSSYSLRLRTQPRPDAQGVREVVVEQAFQCAVDAGAAIPDGARGAVVEFLRRAQHVKPRGVLAGVRRGF